jgi:hypothetical protein
MKGVIIGAVVENIQMVNEDSIRTSNKTTPLL